MQSSLQFGELPRRPDLPLNPARHWRTAAFEGTIRMDYGFRRDPPGRSRSATSTGPLPAGSGRAEVPVSARTRPRAYASRSAASQITRRLEVLRR